MSLPTLSYSFPAFAAVDEGLDRILLVNRGAATIDWTHPLKEKCRSLQWLSSGRLLGVCDTGYLEIDSKTGKLCRELRAANSGVISAERLGNGHTLLGGVGLTEGSVSASPGAPGTPAGPNCALAGRAMSMTAKEMTKNSDLMKSPGDGVHTV